MTDYMNDNFCEECGEPIDDQAEFNLLADQINDVLAAFSPEHEIGVLVMMLSRAIAGICPEDRSRAMADIIGMLQDDTKRWVQQWVRRMREDFLVYIHIDPEERKLIYVGMASYPGRPYEFRDRNPIHGRKLRDLIAQGWHRRDIAHVVVDGLSAYQAKRIESQLIRLLRPPCNISDHPWWADQVARRSRRRVKSLDVTYEQMARLAVDPFSI